MRKFHSVEQSVRLVVRPNLSSTLAELVDAGAKVTKPGDAGACETHWQAKFHGKSMSFRVSWSLLRLNYLGAAPGACILYPSHLLGSSWRDEFGFTEGWQTFFCQTLSWKNVLEQVCSSQPVFTLWQFCSVAKGLRIHPWAFLTSQAPLLHDNCPAASTNIPKHPQTGR